MKKILFQGDSITDAARHREYNDLGTGYPVLVGSRLGYEKPGAYEFINRGVSGNRVVDLLARWKEDCLNLKPDILSILIGVNDVWHELNVQNGVDAEKYEKVYDMILEDVKNHLPNTKIILMEPYLMHGPATDEKWEVFSSEVALRREAVHRLSRKYRLPVVPLQTLFDEACKKAPASVWTGDGVHPTSAGHQVIANAWLKAFDDIEK